VDIAREEQLSTSKIECDRAATAAQDTVAYDRLATVGPQPSRMTDKSLHVLQVTGAMNRGGAEVMLMDILRHLSPAVRCDLLINVKKDNPQPHGDFDEEIKRLGARLFYIGTQWELGIARYIARFREIIREIGTPDVVHIHLNAKCGVIALAARMCGVKKIIAHSHAALKFRGPLYRRLPNIFELTFQKMLIAACATDFWGCSSAANASLFYRRFLHRGQTMVINNAVDVQAFQSVRQATIRAVRASYGAKEGALVLGNVGRVVRHKKVDFPIDVLKILHERGVDAVFAFAGRPDDESYMREIQEKIRNHHLEGRAIHLGDRGDVPAVMSAFDVFVGPAVNEGFGLVAAEAQAAGVPCVLSTGFPPSVDMGLGLVTFVHAYDPARWADAIVACRTRRCSDRELIRQRIADRGFDVVENTRRIEQLYRS
jgi:glycosyltransferase EpsF